MVTVNKTKSGSYDAAQLQKEINQSDQIVPSCLSITGTGNDLALDFAATLSGSEDTALDTIIADHTPALDNIVNVAELPFSEIDGKKLSVHGSYKPAPEGVTTYAVWAGAGDNMATGEIGGGSLAFIKSEPGSSEKSIDIEFHPDHGRVWIHEGYLKFTDGGEGDYTSADVVAKATPLQTSANLDLEVNNNWITYAAGGAGTGTHGWADSDKIVLLPRPYSQDGDWDYDGTNLTPNMSGTGGYKISDIERVAHRYFSKIPCYGSCSSYFSMTSEETTELPKNFFLRITSTNVSDTTWYVSIIMEIYRERTYVP